MLAEVELASFSAGELLCRQGDEPGGFYGVLSGRLKLSTLREDGKEAILTVLDPGNWFGEGAMVSGLPRAHDITAIEPVQLLIITTGAFERLMQRNQFARAIAVLACMHMSLVYQMLEDATLHSIRARIARRLRRLACGDATMATDRRRDIPVSQDTLAMMLGVTRQTLALELKAMVARGAVALRYGHIEILSAEILKTFEEHT